MFEQSARVVLGEQSSLGTLVELAVAVHEALAEVVASEPPSKDAGKKGVSTLRSLMETSLTFGATQMVVWNSRLRGTSDQSMQQDLDDFGRQSTARDGRGTGGRALGPIVGDLIDILNIAKVTLEKSGIGKRANMAAFLRGFLDERV
jgi:hypothetical protein